LPARIVGYKAGISENEPSMMDEPTQRYRKIRRVLEQLVRTWPVNLPGAAYEDARVYLDFHCADCGAKLSVNDLAVVLELEMLRLGTVDTRRVPYYDPICVRCYIGGAAPVCSVADHIEPAISAMSDDLLLETRSVADVITRPDACQLSRHMTTELSQAIPTNTAMLPDKHAEKMTIRHVPVNRRSWRDGHSWYLIGAMILVLLMSIVLLAFQPAGHVVTIPTHPTPGARSATGHPAAILARPTGGLLACCRG